MFFAITSAYLAKRMQIGPRAVEGSTTFPRWVICTTPFSTSRLAARRAGSINDRQPSSTPTCRAASLGQMDASFSRLRSNPTIASSNFRSKADTFCCRHLLEQYFTCSHWRSHFLRQANVRPHETHTLQSVFVAWPRVTNNHLTSFHDALTDVADCRV